MHMHSGPCVQQQSVRLYSGPCVCTVALCASQVLCLQGWSDNQLMPDVLCVTQSIRCNCSPADKHRVVTVGGFAQKGDFRCHCESEDLSSFIQGNTRHTIYVICSSLTLRNKVFYRYCPQLQLFLLINVQWWAPSTDLFTLGLILTKWISELGTFNLNVVTRKRQR